MGEGGLSAESACSTCLQDPTSLKAQLQQLGEQQERLQERTAKARAKAQQVPNAAEMLVSRWTQFMCVCVCIPEESQCYHCQEQPKGAAAAAPGPAQPPPRLHLMVPAAPAAWVSRVLSYTPSCQ